VSETNASIRQTLVGRTIDERYQVERQLGAGAMGAVYVVRHLRLGKRFAMKVIHGELAQVPEFVSRFEQEAKACSFLTHPSCIAVTDFGRAKTGELYLVMEYVEGEPLGDTLERGPLSLAEALTLTREVLEGLEHAHAAGIIHRDMKLDNVMRVEVGERLAIKILDFGIAKVPVSGPDGKLTQAGVIFGTPEFMAPEQAVSTQVDARADLYAVGVMLWRMLLVEPPLVAEDYVALLNKKLVEPAPALEEVAPGRFSPQLAAFVARALEREPGKRFATAREMIDALDALGEAPQLARRTTSTAAAISRTEAGLGARLDSLFRGTGRFVRGGGSAAVGFVARTAQVFWRCEDFPGRSPSWGLRARALVTTSRGALVLGALLAPLLLIGLLALGDDEPTAALVTLPTIDEKAAAGSSAAKRPPRPKNIDSATEKRLLAVRLFLAKKACREATLDLRNLLRDKPKLAGAHYLLGAAEVCRRRYKKGLAAYRQAVRFDPRYRSDARIGEDLARMLRRRKLRKPVLDFIDAELGEAGLKLLSTLASTHRKRRVRAAARKRLEARGAAGRIDEVAALSKDLLQTGSCKKKRSIVKRLQALGDVRALPALRRARRAKGGFLGWSKINRCIYRQLKEAIEALEARSGGASK
jgi:tRNA A-37 threonylcarbamoyl transferase component Bud32